MKHKTPPTHLLYVSLRTEPQRLTNHYLACTSHSQHARTQCAQVTSFLEVFWGNFPFENICSLTLSLTCSIQSSSGGVSPTNTCTHPSSADYPVFTSSIIIICCSAPLFLTPVSYYSVVTLSSRVMTRKLWLNYIIISLSSNN